jgi:hypothetical protein
MSFNLKKLLNIRNILLLLLVLFVVIVGYNVFVYLKIFEGLYEINNNIKTIVISPLEGTPPEWLNIEKITLTDVGGSKIPYTAVSSNGRWNWPHGGYYLDTERLYDNTDSRQSMFHSGQTGCTLTITVTDSSKTLSNITIRNRRECCQYRLKHYKISFKNASGIDVIPSLPLDRPNLFDSTKDYTETLTIPILSSTVVSDINSGKIQNN